MSVHFPLITIACTALAALHSLRRLRCCAGKLRVAQVPRLAAESKLPGAQARFLAKAAEDSVKVHGDTHTGRCDVSPPHPLQCT